MAVSSFVQVSNGIVFTVPLSPTNVAAVTGYTMLGGPSYAIPYRLRVNGIVLNPTTAGVIALYTDCTVAADGTVTAGVKWYRKNTVVNTPEVIAFGAPQDFANLGVDTEGGAGFVGSVYLALALV